MSAGGSSLFSEFRILGLYSNHVPHALRYHQKHREFYLVTATGKSFQTFNVKRLGLVSVSNPLEDDITCLAADRLLVFAAAGRCVYAFARGKEVVRRYHGHGQEVQLLLPVGDRLVSADAGEVIVWEVQSGDVYLRLPFDPACFRPSAILHPAACLNKVLLGSSQGAMQLWNVRTGKLVHGFAGWSSGVTALQQSPALHVVAVGTATGRVIVHDIKADRTLMEFQQDDGPISSLSFRTDGPPLLASAGARGSVSFWDLERRRLSSALGRAHRSAVAAATFVHGEPLLVTSGADNAVRVWIDDDGGGGGAFRLLRSRQGHGAPPTALRHHDADAVLSGGRDGEVLSFSTAHQRLDRKLGSFVSAHGSKKKHRHHHGGLEAEPEEWAGPAPAVVALGSSVARQADWDAVVACHRGRVSATTWSYGRGGGRGLLLPPATGPGAVATAADVTSCGNFAVIGLSSGRVDVYNLQSRLHRGCYGDEGKAHAGAVRGVATDTLNQLTLTLGSDWLLRFWRFKTRRLEAELKLAAAPASMALHRDSNMLAVALDDFTLNVVDVETKRLVRKFSGHRGNVTDMTFSPDGRWLVTAAMDCTLRTFDLPSGRLLDCLCVAAAPVAVSFSPSGDFLASCHSDGPGVTLWANQSLLGPAGLRPPPEQEVTSQPEQEVEFKSAEQLGAELLTLSLLPESRWKNLLRLEDVRKRNRPLAPPPRPPRAPFFLPTIPGVSPSFSLPPADRPQSKLLPAHFLSGSSAFSMSLRESSADLSLRLLMDSGPAVVSMEISGLSSGGAGNLFVPFLRMIDAALASGRSYELAQSYLALFLQIHLREVSRDAVAMETLTELGAKMEARWAELRASFDQSLCLLSYAKSALL